MLRKSRVRRSFKKKLTVYILLLTILVFFISSFFLSSKPLFISPMGKNNIDTKKVEKILRDKSILFSQVLILSDLSYGINIQNNGQVRLSSKKDIIYQITSLQRILKQLTIEGKPFKSIDFRFEEPIISF